MIGNPIASRIGILVFVCGTALLNTSQVHSAEQADRPNIIFAIADDWSWPHAGAYGDRLVKTPTFDRVASEGVRFTRSFCASPSCTPSRGAILTGQAIHRLEAGGNLWSFLLWRFRCFPDLLEESGYVIGLQGKGWGPGTLEGSGRTRNPAGPGFRSFEQFLKKVPRDKPFCFWFGSHDPHRPYEKGSGVRSGKRIEDVKVPPFLPDTPQVRSDLLDYYFEVERFDREVGQILDQLAAGGRAQNTIVVITSDNGMPFPRAKANLYDSGTHMPLAIRWPARIKPGQTIDDFISHTDLAPTLLEAVGMKPLEATTGRSFLPRMLGEKATPITRVFTERERHANVRRGDLSYPARALRTEKFLYIRNFHPERWPAGDPERYISVGPFGDVDGSPTKDLILDHRDEPKYSRFFDLAFAKRPMEELYDLSKDPEQLINVAGQPEYAADQQKLWTELQQWMSSTGDPRAKGEDERWDHYPYFGPEAKVNRESK